MFYSLGHNFYFAKFKIETIKVLAGFGGAAEVTPEEYFKANAINLHKWKYSYFIKILEMIFVCLKNVYF